MRTLQHAFAEGHSYGLLALALDLTAGALFHDLVFWRDFARRFRVAICARPERGDASGPVLIELPFPDETELEAIADSATPMVGGEFLTSEVLADIWSSMSTALARGQQWEAATAVGYHPLDYRAPGEDAGVGPVQGDHRTLGFLSRPLLRK